MDWLGQCFPARFPRLPSAPIPSSPCLGRPPVPSGVSASLRTRCGLQLSDESRGSADIMRSAGKCLSLHFCHAADRCEHVELRRPRAAPAWYWCLWCSWRRVLWAARRVFRAALLRSVQSIRGSADGAEFCLRADAPCARLVGRLKESKAVLECSQDVVSGNVWVLGSANKL